MTSWWEERNARFAREREEREARLRAQGFRFISCVAYFDSRTGDHPMCTWMGETETLVLLSPPEDYGRYGIGCVLVGPTSEIVRGADKPYDLAKEKSGVVLTVFKGTVPR